MKCCQLLTVCLLFFNLIVANTKRLNASGEIKIADNGNSVLHNIILQPFFTTKPTGQGTGLGLSLAYDIITKGHGGELNVRSRQGEGAEFTVRIPLATSFEPSFTDT